MRRALGILVLIVGIAGLGYWGAHSHAIEIERKIATAAENAVKGTVHPMQVRVSGRDITLTGTADTTAERDRIVAALKAVPGRRVVNADGVTVLPDIAPYETALAKSADGSLAATGYAPSAAARAELAKVVPAVANLPLGHGAPKGWEQALVAGAAALDPLESGSFTLTGQTLTLNGTAATPFEETAARKALAGLDGFETVIALEVIDPGIVDLTIRYDANSGFEAEGVAPEAFDRDTIAAALGADRLTGDLSATYADAPGLGEKIAALAGHLDALETVSLHADNSGARIEATVMPGLDVETVAGDLAEALGGGDNLTVTAAPPPPDGARRINAATGKTQIAAGGVWMNLPDIAVSKATCTAAAMETVSKAPIRFVTGSARLDPASLATINDVAGILHLCTEAPDMRVVIGGHTDAQGDENANYILSVKRAKAVRDALIARGIAPEKLTAVGYGETEPVADNTTEEGRAQNRRTTFSWPD